MSLISRITNDAANPKFAARMTGRSFERAYFVANLPTHMRVPPIGGRSEVLSPESLLYPHRGNEAVFKRKQWSNMCYPPSTTDGNVNFKKGVERMPAEYHQVLFVDLQARERVKGSTMLKDVDAKIWELGKGERVEGVEYGDEKAGKGAVSCGGAVEESDGDRMDVD